eukprot:SAG31_NODE_792_length_12047_cov_14.428607_8_plen_102_part_00
MELKDKVIEQQLHDLGEIKRKAEKWKVVALAKNRRVVALEKELNDLKAKMRKVKEGINSVSETLMKPNHFREFRCCNCEHDDCHRTRIPEKKLHIHEKPLF